MKSQFALAFLIGAGIALVAVHFLKQTRDAQVTLVPGSVTHYVQTFELTEVVADGAEQAELRIEQELTLRCKRALRGDAWEVIVDVGRVRVWVDHLDEEPALDTKDGGYAAAEAATLDPTGVALAVRFVSCPRHGQVGQGRAVGRKDR